MTNDNFQRFKKGLCPMYPCPGRMLMCDVNTKSGTCPEWIQDERVKRGHGRVVEPIEETTYAYKCLECGHEITSTEHIESASKN